MPWCKRLIIMTSPTLQSILYNMIYDSLSAFLFVCQMNHKNRSKWNYISCENGPSFPYKRTNERKILDIKKRFQKVTNDVAKTFSGNQKFRKRDLFVLTSSSTSSRCRFPWYSNNFSMHSIALTTKKDWKNTTKTSSKNVPPMNEWTNASKTGELERERSM